MLLLVLAPALSLLWSSGAGGDARQDLLIAAYCLLWCYFGVARVLARRNDLSGYLVVLILLAGNVAAAVSLLAWGLADDTGPARLVGVWGIDNPVHASVLLLGSTLPVLVAVAAGRARWWLLALPLPLAFALLAGARTAAAAYLLTVLALVGMHRPRALAWVVVAAAGMTVLAVAFVGIERASEIWLARGLSYRDVVWQQVWAAYQACSALLGCGIATPLLVELAGVEGDRAHSIFFAALYHQGLLGLGVFLGALGWLLLRGLRGDAMQVRGWAWMLGFVLLANVTSGDHVLVRGSLFWPGFWIPVMVLAARGGESSPPGRP